MRARLLMPALFGLALAAVAAAQDAAKDDLKRMEGTWRFVSAESDGKKAPDEALKGMVLTITGNKYTVRQGDKVIEKGTQKLDPTKTPKTIDLHIEEGPDKGKDQVGIYELTGDTMKVAFTPAGSLERPKQFDPQSKAGVALLKRDKK